MKAKAIFGSLISLASILGINFIPLEMFLYRDFSAASAMVFYALENVAAIVFATVFVILFAPSQEVNQDYARRDEILKKHPAFAVVPVRKKIEILQGYLVFSVGFSAGSFVFLIAFHFPHPQNAYPDRCPRHRFLLDHRVSMSRLFGRCVNATATHAG